MTVPLSYVLRCKTFLLALNRQGLWLPYELWITLIVPELAMTREEFLRYVVCKMKRNEAQRINAVERITKLDAPLT
jgi:hypothetical protein